MADDNKDKAAEMPTRKRSKGTGGLQLEKTGIWTLRCTINGKRIAKSTAAQRLGGWGDNGEAASPRQTKGAVLAAVHALALYLDPDGAEMFRERDEP